MKEVVDTVITGVFVLFMIWIVVGYHRQRGHHKRDEK